MSTGPAPNAPALAGVGYWTWDLADGRIRWDPTIERLYGLDPGAFGGTFEAWADLIHPEDRRRAIEAVQEAMATASSFVFEHRCVWPDGTLRWIESRGEFVSGDGGATERGFGIALDTSHRHREYDEYDRTLGPTEAERATQDSLELAWARFAQLQILAVRLAGAAGVDDVARVLVDQGAAALGADGGFFTMVEPDIGRLTLRAARGASRDVLDFYRSLPIDSATAVAHVARTGEAVYLSSRQEAEAMFPGHPFHGAEAFLAYPVVLGGEVRAVLAYGYAEPHEFLDEEMELAATIAGMSAQSLQRADLHDAAGRAASRSQALESVLGRLAGAATAYEVAETVVQHLLPAVGATKGSLFLVDEAGGELRALAIHGYDRDTTTRFEAIPLDAAAGPTDAVRTQAPLVIHGWDDFARRYPQLAEGASPEDFPATSFMFPLIVQGKAIGALGIGFDDPNPIGEEVSRHLSIVAHICAQTLGRAQALEQAQAAHARLLSIDQITDAALSRLSFEELLQELPGRIATAIGCDAVRIFLVDETGEMLEVRGQYGTTGEDLARVPVGRGLAGTISATGKPRIIDDITRHEVIRPAFPDHVVSEAGVPLRSGGRVIGVLDVGAGPDRPLTEQDVEILEIAAERIATAIDRSRAYEIERAARQRSELIGMLADIVNQPGPLGTQLERMAKLAADTIADCCVIAALSDSGPPLVVRSHRNPDAAGTIDEIVTRNPFGPAVSQGFAEVIRSGKPEIHPLIDDEYATDLADALLRDLCQTLELGSAMTVPLPGASGPLGAMLLARHRSNHPFSSEEVLLAEDLASRMGAAVESRRAFERHRSTAMTLQRSLLPSSLPTIPGLEIAARYWPASELSEVGGDFYDLIELGDDRWGVMVGDVSGKGVAAAAMTGIARYTARAAARHGRSPREVLHWVHEAFLSQARTTESYCTAIFGILERTGPSGFHFRFAVGGHPLPILKRPGAGCEFVGSPGTVLGLIDSVELTETEVVLGGGESLLIYTDGVTDVPVPDALTDTDLLRLVDDWAALDASSALDSLDQVLQDRYGESESRDDAAVLLIRCNS